MSRDPKTDFCSVFCKLFLGPVEQPPPQLLAPVPLPQHLALFLAQRLGLPLASLFPLLGWVCPCPHLLVSCLLSGMFRVKKSGQVAKTDLCFLPAFPPMPVPPAGFAGLTPEELRALEGHERQHLEARLQSLRNIHTLLDAAMLQINQYLTVLASLGYAYQILVELKRGPLWFLTFVFHMPCSIFCFLRPPIYRHVWELLVMPSAFILLSRKYIHSCVESVFINELTLKFIHIFLNSYYS